MDCIAGVRRFGPTDCVLPSLEVAGPGGHWVEVSRAICPGAPSDHTKRMLEAYEEYYAAAPAALRAGGSVFVHVKREVEGAACHFAEAVRPLRAFLPERLLNRRLVTQ